MRKLVLILTVIFFTYWREITANGMSPILISKKKY